MPSKYIDLSHLPPSLSDCLSVCLSLCFSLRLCLSISLSFSLSISAPPSLCLSQSLSPVLTPSCLRELFSSISSVCSGSGQPVLWWANRGLCHPIYPHPGSVVEASLTSCGP